MIILAGKILLIGGIGSGKTSLRQYLSQENVSYRKTQVLEFSDWFIDCPGEYLEIPRYHYVLIDASHRVSVICALQDATKKQSFFVPQFLKVFSKPVLGVITKIDLSDADVDRASTLLNFAGLRDSQEVIFPVSVKTGEGVNRLKNYLMRNLEA